MFVFSFKISYENAFYSLFEPAADGEETLLLYHEVDLTEGMIKGNFPMATPFESSESAPPGGDVMSMSTQMISLEIAVVMSAFEIDVVVVDHVKLTIGVIAVVVQNATDVIAETDLESEALLHVKSALLLISAMLL